MSDTMSFLVLPKTMTVKERRKKLKEILKDLYFNQIDDYFEAKDQLVADLNSLDDDAPLIYKNKIVEVLKGATEY